MAGGIPIIANISQCLSANQIQSIDAILNGTSNYILTQMEARGHCLWPARRARPSSWAMPKPIRRWTSTAATRPKSWRSWLNLAFGARVSWCDIPRRGIDTLDVADLRFAKELGYRIKLLAVARLGGGGLELHVSPTLVRSGTPLAEVRGRVQCDQRRGRRRGSGVFSGLGAGQMPTASAVVADMIDTVVGRAAITFRSLELWSKQKARVPASDLANVAGRYYLRFNVERSAHRAGRDRRHAGTARHLDRFGHPARSRRTDSGVVPLVIMTHSTTEGATSAGRSKPIDRMEFMRGGSVRMRVDE